MKINNVVYMINSGCNFRCKFCLNNWKYDSRPVSNLSFENKLRILDKIQEFGIENLTISGGEPLLDRDLDKLIDYGYKLGIKILLLTNGSLISESFLDNVKGKLEWVQVSLEGNEEVHNFLTETKSFNKVIKNIKLIKSKDFKLMTNFTITKLNYKNLEEYVLLLKELKVDIANFTRVYPSGFGRKNWKELILDSKEYEKFIVKLNEIANNIKEIKFRIAGPTPMCLLEKNKINLEFNTCGAGVDELAINPDGEVLPCPSWGNGIGNLLEKSFDQILNCYEMNEIKNRSVVNSICKSCNYFEKCGGGCLLHVMQSKNGRDIYMVKT